MANSWTRALLVALAVTAPMTALADVTYTYTGKNFTDSAADWHLPRDLPPGTEEQESARIAAELLSSNLTVSIKLPVYLPTGWNNFSFAEILSPALINTFTTLQNTHTVGNPTISLTMAAAGLSGGGTVDLQGPVQFTTYFAASVLVDNNHQIVDWNITASGFDPDDSASFASTPGGDSTGLSMNPGPRGWLNYRASNSASGVWSITGSEVSAVPEISSSAALLAGIVLMAGIAWRRRKALGHTSTLVGQPFNMRL